MSIRTLQPLDALTIWQPWAWAIAEGIKLVENREWKPPERAIGQLIAIHAGVRKPTVMDVAEVRALCVPVARSRDVPFAAETTCGYVLGAVLAIARVDRYVESADELPMKQRGWFRGRYGWVLRDVRKLATPLTVKGNQGLWPLPGELVHQVWEQLEPQPFTREYSGQWSKEGA